MKKAQIFLSYAREDKEKVEKLYQELSGAGFKPWMDKEDILAGERWRSRIQGAIRHSDFFLACLSANSIDKRGVLQWEIKQALDIWQEKLDSDIYLIPVRLEDCEAPESLLDFQWVNLFEEDGLARLVKAIQEGMKRRKEIKPAVQKSVPSGPRPAHSQEKLELGEAKKPRRRHVTRIAWATLNVVVFTIMFALFQNQISAIGDSIMKWWLESRATPTPTMAVPGVGRIEVFMNGGQLKLDQLPNLTSGEAVVLEVAVFDTNGKRYTSDDLVCMWSVAPLGDEDREINTDLCKTLYVPSREYSTQTVSFKAEGLEQQFEPGDPISMKFDIVQ